jgi:hypothetical protein
MSHEQALATNCCEQQAMAPLNILGAIIVWLIVTTGGALLFLPKQSSLVIVIPLLFFNNLNTLIAILEIVLAIHISRIQEDYRLFKDKYHKREWEACLAFLFTPLTLSSFFDGKLWSKMWSTYALYDPSYQNHESFGFFIDFGNGMSTIPPFLLWNFAILFPHKCSALLLGCVGIASYWQVLYGTLIYIVSFLFNRRYKDLTYLEIWGFVGFFNSLWIFFPLLGIYASVCVLRDGDFSVFKV